MRLNQSVPKLVLLWLVMLCCAPSHSQDITSAFQTIKQHPQQQLATLIEQAPQSRDANLWLQLAYAHQILDQGEPALAALQQALQLNPEPLLAVRIWELKAQILGRLFRDTQRAIDALQNAEQLLTPLEHPEKPALQASIFESFAQAYNQTGRTEDAARYAAKSIEIANQHQLWRHELYARLIAGRIALLQDDYLLSQVHLSRALSLANEHQIPNVLGSIHMRLGMAYRYLADWELSRQHLEAAIANYPLPTFRADHIKAQIQRAETLMSAGDLTAAEQQLEQAASLLSQQKDLQLNALHTLARAHLAAAQRQPRVSEQRLRHAHDQYRQLNSNAMRIEVALELVRLLHQQQRYDEITPLLPSVAEIQLLGRRQQFQYWQLMAQLAAEQQRFDVAFHASKTAHELQQNNHQQQQKQYLTLLQATLDHNQQATQLQQLQQRLQRQQQWLVVGTAIGVLLFGLALWWLRRQQQQQRQTQQRLNAPYRHFLRTLHRGSSAPNHLQIIRLSDAFLAQQGPQQLERTLQHYMTLQDDPALMGWTIYQQQLWIHWRCPEASWMNIQQQQQDALQLLAHKLQTPIQQFFMDDTMLASFATASEHALGYWHELLCLTRFLITAELTTSEQAAAHAGHNTLAQHNMFNVTDHATAAGIATPTDSSSAAAHSVQSIEILCPFDVLPDWQLLTLRDALVTAFRCGRWQWHPARIVQAATVDVAQPTL